MSRFRSARATKSSPPRSLSIGTVTIAFVLGYLLGNLFSLSSIRNDELLHCHTEGSAALMSSSSMRVLSEERKINGWHSVDVFYGSSKHLEDTLNSSQVWYSQVHQDQAINALFRGKRNGFFVDLAANDATTLSNTYSLEKQLGWTGLCIEPNPVYWSNLTYRDCQVVAAVVGKTRMEEVHFRFDAGDHGGIAGDAFDNGAKFKSTASPRYTVTLLEIFAKYNVPTQIDYLSLDVEGAEEFIMSAFPLDKYTISVLTVERPSETIQKIFDENGYTKIMRLSRWGETLWAHKSVMDSLDLDSVIAFDPKKLREKV